VGKNRVKHGREHWGKGGEEKRGVGDEVEVEWEWELEGREKG